MELLTQFVDLFLHLDKHLDQIIRDYGVWAYVILFAIVFCETGLVVTPFLPGDSLLFAAGTFAKMGSFDLTTLVVVLLVAAILGDAVNYACGHYLGPKVFRKEGGRFLKKEYLDRTHRFYETYGNKTIVLARFAPIVRTFAPFIAGVGNMSYSKFLTYNVVGAIAWVFIFVFGGYWFGSIPAVKQNFTLVMLAIIFVSVLPAVIEVWRTKLVAKA